MMPSRPSGLQLQRRTGRRKSTPASPTSPTLQRRFGRSQDFLWPSEPKSATSAVESPLIDLTVPSSALDLTSTSPTLDNEDNGQQRPQPANRASDDFGKARPRILEDTARPATSGNGVGKTHTSQSRSTYSPEPADARDSPLISSRRTSSETPRRSSSRETQDDSFISSLRASAFASQHDRGFFEDSTTAKGTANKKSRFNLLKSPMSLLASRRSAQNANKMDEMNLNVGTLHVPAMPDHVKPTIRGKIIHDFSTPKARRANNDISPRPGPIPSPSYPRRPSDIASPALTQMTGTPASVHSPMFKEHFQEDQRSIQPTNTAYLHGQNLQVPIFDALPSFAKRLPLSVPNMDDVAVTSEVDISPKQEERKQRQLSDELPPEPDIPPPPPPKRTPSPTLEFIPTGALPRHMTSTSSRFSFQIGQQGSIAQEKFLEEKHKEHAARQPADVRLSVTSIDDVNDYDDYENGLDDDGGFDIGEITIKNIEMPSSHIDEFTAPVEEDHGYSNEYDNDDDEFGTGDIEIRNIDVPTSQKNQEGHVTPEMQRNSLQEFHFTPQSLTFSPSTEQHTSESTPRDFEGFPIGTAESKESGSYRLHPQIRNSVDTSPETMFFEGLGISTAPQREPTRSISNVGTQPFDDSELYFDDGEFADHVADTANEFDENILDDATKIKDIPAENARKYEEAIQRSLPGEKIKVVASDAANESLTASQPSVTGTGTLGEDHEKASSEQPDLTEGNLAAYHDALAMAANQAAANGKFDRNVSFSRVSDDGTESSFRNSVHGISSRGSHYSNNIMSSGLSDDNAFGFDEDMDDDDMIAAANAEALENDDDGIYGQEFGFYARAHSKDTAEFLNGGYFTARGSNGLKRSHSGRNNFQEPSLTPITERSEWSARNSVYSLPIHPGVPGTAQSLPSPGIAELLSMDSPIVDDEMSYTALLKLRRSTFGGSSTSVNSLGERHHSISSPLAHVGAFNPSPSDLISGRMSSPMAGVSGLSIAEFEDEDDSNDRPTLTQNTPQKVKAQPVIQTQMEQVASSPLSRKGNHSRNSSGAESVSYAQDKDGRWILEKRWTGDDGEVEVIGREYLPGVRI